MMPSTPSFHCVALIPAAGSGTRLGGSAPKQYQDLAGFPMLVQTIRALQSHAAISHVYVVVAADDTLFTSLCAPHLNNCTPLYVGADTRAGSVYAGLATLSGLLPSVNSADHTDLADHKPDPWILVHDAARPCLHSEDLHTLLDALQHVAADETAAGYVLSNPVADTLKKVHANSTEVLETVSRDTLWQAQTPQAARLSILRDALHHALYVKKNTPTDEAQALEWKNHKVQLIKSNHPNFKITYLADQQLAEAVLLQNSTHKNF